MAWFGINNENEFYSEHYLSEIFSGDIKARLESWKEQEEQSKASQPDNPILSPSTRLYQQVQTALQTFKQLEQDKTPASQLATQREWLQQLLNICGFTSQPQRHPLEDDLEIPLLAA